MSHYTLPENYAVMLEAMHRSTETMRLAQDRLVEMAIEQACTGTVDGDMAKACIDVTVATEQFADAVIAIIQPCFEAAA
jgi:hypothetical protein